MESGFKLFRDNDGEHGRYDESTDSTFLPYCINHYSDEDVVKHMAHELFHAFQCYVICNPKNYPCIDSKAI